MNAVGISSTSAQPYPCDQGFADRVGRALHHFEAGQTGVVICRYCGRPPRPVSYARGGVVGPSSTLRPHIG